MVTQNKVSAPEDSDVDAARRDQSKGIENSFETSATTNEPAHNDGRMSGCRIFTATVSTLPSYTAQILCSVTKT